MDWKVVNGLSRDVERQHLNKILADIRSTVSGLTSSSSSPSTVTNTVVTRYAVANFLLSLTGAVEGQAQVTGLGDVTIETSVGDGIVEEAPGDNKFYWRWNGQWSQVPGSLAALSNLSNDGIVVFYEDSSSNDTRMTTREIEVATGELTVSNADGVSGNPLLGLDDTAVTPGTYGDADNVPQITVDQKGRITNVVEIPIAGGGGILPVVTGEVPPVLVYLEDGSLVYAEVA